MKMLSQVFFFIIMVVGWKYSQSHANFRKSYKENMKQIPRPSENKKPTGSIQHEEGEYKFRYRVFDGKGNMHYHAQHRSKTGVVRGCYGYTDVKGLYRIVEYTADDGGFRVKIHSQEPGIHRKNPSDVKMNVYSPLTGVGYSYVHPCVDTVTKPEPDNIGTTKSTRGNVAVTDPWKETTTRDYEKVWTESPGGGVSDTFPPDEEEKPTPDEPMTETYPAEEEIPPVPTEEEELIPEPPYPPEDYIDYETTTDISSTTSGAPSGGIVAPVAQGIQNFTKDPREPGGKEFEKDFETDCYCEVGGPGVEKAKSLGMKLNSVLPKQGVNVLSVENPEALKAKKPDVTYPAECLCGFTDRYKGVGGPTDLSGLKQNGNKKK